MQLTLGTTIRQLRHRDGRTQEALANALGVTAQAVSRWEANGSYPDMEMIPAIANYFSVTIDELFGYRNDREEKVENIIRRIEACGIKSRADDEWVGECLCLLREGLAEFPQNEKLLVTLAETLSEAGWRRYHERLCYDGEGFLQHDPAHHRKNEYWSEAIKICENLADTASDRGIVTRAIHTLVLLCRNLGETEKALQYAMQMPELNNCRELMLAAAVDGKQEAKYVGDFLLKAASEISKQLVYGLMTNIAHFSSDLPIEKVKGAIGLFYLICDDGNLGCYHDPVIGLYLYLSRLQWERGYRDEAFASLDEALFHAKALEAVCDGEEHRLTAPLVSFVTYRMPVVKGIAKSLPEDWPFWHCPDPGETAKEIKADPRWKIWEAKTAET